MQLPPLQDGCLVRRYQRFLADIELADGRMLTAHCPNSGSMRSCQRPGAPVQFSHSDNHRRKLAWTLERIDMGHGWVGINTQHANPVIAEGIAAGRLSGLSGYDTLRREVPMASAGIHGRLDIMLQHPGRADVLIEVKNVTLLERDCLMFPDTFSERARRHLALLCSARDMGMHAVLVFALNRPEGVRFAPALAIDPDYGIQLQRAAAHGIEIMAVRLEHGPDSITTGNMVPVDL
jgi:sugar fermentation stimulation protein A